MEMAHPTVQAELVSVLRFPEVARNECARVIFHFSVISLGLLSVGEAASLMILGLAIFPPRLSI